MAETWPDTAIAKILRLEQERDRLKEENGKLAEGNLQAQHRAAKENQRLRAAMEWYADKANYIGYVGDVSVHLDNGGRARKALAGESETTQKGETPCP